ncbi:MAG: HAMP domain-containing histidine kinase [Campylobacterales bacterium]|nr:HAMP domain-containing histidine kinase [Campylobacterales bacterium]
MENLESIDDNKLIEEISRRFEEKQASIKEMEFMTKKLLDLNEQAKEAEAVKSQFLSLIKNEFNNPISSLLSLSGKLVNNSNPDRIPQIGNMINEELLRLDFQLKNLFSASEIEAGNIADDLTTVNFGDILDDAVKSFKYVINEKNLVVKFKEDEDLRFVTDSQKLYLILLNLISNACEFSFPDSKIKVKISENNGEIKIKVEDFGEGIAVHFHKEIYNRFARYSTGKTRAHSGLGLGLSIVRALVESMDGSVDFQSEEGNTTFTVILPKLSEDLAEGGSGGSNDFMFEDFGEDDGEMLEL